MDLLNEVVEMGYAREYALESIDAALDEEFGFENRKSLSEEFLSDELYNTILFSFEEQKEWKEIEKEGIKNENNQDSMQEEELEINATWLKGARYVNNLTQKELAEKTGISKATIENIEQGKRKGSKETWDILTKFFEKYDNQSTKKEDNQ